MRSTASSQSKDRRCASCCSSTSGSSAPDIHFSTRSHMIEQRTLGKSGIKVSAIGLGLMSMSGIYGNANDEESIRVIHHALDKGINHLDSSDMYGWGHNETLLGKALKGRGGGLRDGVVVATKFGQTK